MICPCVFLFLFKSLHWRDFCVKGNHYVVWKSVSSPNLGSLPFGTWNPLSVLLQLLKSCAAGQSNEWNKHLFMKIRLCNMWLVTRMQIYKRLKVEHVPLHSCMRVTQWKHFLLHFCTSFGTNSSCYQYSVAPVLLLIGASVEIGFLWGLWPK